MSAWLQLFDSSVYIPYYRGEAYEELVERATRGGRVRMSAVVLSELYAGTRSSRDKGDLDVQSRVFERLRFLIVPDAADWMKAGQVIRRFSRLRGRIEPREHLNDVLITLGAWKAGATLVTENAEPFRQWVRLLGRMGVRVKLQSVRRADHRD